MTSPYRNRISLNLRSGYNHQPRPLQEQTIQKPLDKLEVVIPPRIADTISPRERWGLKPVQENVRMSLPDTKKEMRIKPIEEMIEEQKQKQRFNVRKRKHQLVNDEDIPAIIVDHKRKKQYKKLRCLGSGAFGKVYRIQKETNGQYFAAKIVSKRSLCDKSTRKKLFAEINIHRSLKHDYIVKLIEYAEDKNNIYLVLEYCPNNTLSEMLKNRGNLTELEVRYYMGQIFCALRYLSDNRILHRDLKTSNVLLDTNMDSKVCDFGLAALLLEREDRKRTICGTPHYIAPEILFRNGHNYKSDMWSAGVMMFNLLFGKQPFHYEDYKALYRQVKLNEISTQFTFPVNDYGVSKEAKDLISKLLVNNPDARLSVVGALNHPFFHEDIPEQIPKSALFQPPDYRDLFPGRFSSSSSSESPTNTPILSKVAIAVQQAKDAKRSYVDRNVRPPMTIMTETILDHRSQYPVSQENVVTPATLSARTLTIPTEYPNTTVSFMSISSTDKRPANGAIEEEDTNLTMSSKKLRSDNSNDVAQTSLTKDKLRKSQTELSSVSQITGGNNLLRNNLFIPIDEEEGADNKLKDDNATKSEHTILPPPRNMAPTKKRPVIEDMVSKLEYMINRISAIPSELRAKVPRTDQDFNWGKQNIFINSWVDCSKTYGFAYGLSDGTLGFLFNDGSTLTLNDPSYYHYTERKNHEIIEKEFEEAKVPVELKKKCAILNKFKSYEGKKLKREYGVPKATTCTTTRLYKYFVSDDAIAFRLSNDVIQVNFFAHDKVILYERGQKIIYINKQGQLSHHHTFDAFCSNHKELTDAIKRTHAILVEQSANREESLRRERWQRFVQGYSRSEKENITQ
ncbi:MAG: kinase-like domain-containing protein [Benjaminiella poitrasii]|nr:MAG: kinase-like domain-containing protein [Benjaminiella poitrasii]